MVQVDCFNHWCEMGPTLTQIVARGWVYGLSKLISCAPHWGLSTGKVDPPLSPHSLYLLWALFLQPAITGHELLHYCKVFPSTKPAAYQDILGYSTPFSLNSFRNFMALVNNIISFSQEFNILTPMSKYIYIFWVPMTALGPEKNSLPCSKYVS